MKILINTASSFKGGGIQVAKSYLEEFRKFSENEYFVVLSANLADAIDRNDFTSNFKFYTAPFRPATKFFSLQSHNYFLKGLEKEWKPDIVFSTAGPSYWRPKAKHVMGYTIPHYVYPESPYFDLIGWKRRTDWNAKKILAKILFKRDADVLITQTEDVSARVRKFLQKEKVFTISNTINSHFLHPIKVAKKLGVRENNEFRLLILSAWYPHKNLAIIPKVIAVLRNMGVEHIKFIVTLPPEDFKKLSNTDNEKNLINLGKIKIDDGASLYQECDALFLPTLLECFSASYAEAMVMHKPILTSNLGFSHTVCGDAAIYFDPMNPKDMAAKIIEVYENKELQRDLIAKGKKQLENFGTAEDRAVRILKICEEIVHENEK